MFKVGHYYKVNHCGTKSIIKILRYIGGSELWEIKIIKLLNGDDLYHDGLITNWYEEWCNDITEIKNNEELIAVIL